MSRITQRLARLEARLRERRQIIEVRPAQWLLDAGAPDTVVVIRYVEGKRAVLEASARAAERATETQDRGVASPPVPAAASVVGGAPVGGATAPVEPPAARTAPLGDAPAATPEGHV